MEKSKSERIKEKTISSLQSTIKTLEQRVLDAQVKVQVEVEKLERLRNEEQHIQASLNDLAKKDADFNAFKSRSLTEMEEAKTSILSWEQSVRKEEAAAARKLKDASEKLKEATAKVKTAEIIEGRIVEGKKILAKQILEIADLERGLIEKEVTVNQLQDKNITLVMEARRIEKENAVASIKLNLRAKKLATEDTRINNLLIKNEEKLKAAEQYKVEADMIKEQAEKVAKDSQLSVDRQWNEIEIQKKNIKILQLRMEKLAKEKNIEKELKELETK